MSTLLTALASHRFGYGARPGDLDRSEEPRQALLAELEQTAEPSPFAGLPRAARILTAFNDDRRAKLQANEQAGMQPKGMAEAALAGQSPSTTSVPGLGPGSPGDLLKGLIKQENEARIAVALAAPYGFRERLVQFWANLFTVAGPKPQVPLMCGAYEREAIRPHLTGTFDEMLLAVERHPAMLVYLDNVSSFGPGSEEGVKRRLGLNENLAREILELHTVGTHAGYTQDDVTELARIITGWSLHWRTSPSDTETRTFAFHPEMHEPGVRTLLGRTYDQPGEEKGDAALRDLAVHPETARRLALRIARHFVADDPDPPLVERLEQTFTASGGNLMRLYETLVAAPEAWAPDLLKLRLPFDFVVAAARAYALPPDRPVSLAFAATTLGQPTGGAPSPKGWPDDVQAWAAPDAIKTRLDWADNLARRLPDVDPVRRAAEVLGPLLTEETRDTIAQAETRHQASVMLLMSPEFQRR